MIRRPPRSTRTDTLFPYTTLFRSSGQMSKSGEIVMSDVIELPRKSGRPVAEPERLSLAVAGMTCASCVGHVERSEEHTSELQSLMRISYAVFCLKKKKNERTKICYSHYNDLCAFPPYL